MYGVTVTGQPVAAVVVEHRRDEMQLDVGPRIAGQRRAHEGAGFGNVAGAGAAMATQEIIERDAHLAQAVVADRLGAMLQRADVQVILQVAADTRCVHDDGNRQVSQVRRRPDAGKQQQLGRIDRAAAEDDFARRHRADASTTVHVNDTAGTRGAG